MKFKRLITACLSLLICFSLTGFTGLAEAAETTALEENNGTAAGKVTVVVTPYSEVFSAPDNSNKLFFEFSYSQPKVTVYGNDAASEEINEHLAVANELFYSGYLDMPGVAAAYEYAIDAYSYYSQTEQQPEGSFYSCRNVKVLRADSGVVSVMFTDSSYFGVSEKSEKYIGMCFSAESGKTLSYYNLGPDAEALNASVIQSLNSDYHINVNGYETALYFIGLSEKGIELNINGDFYTVEYAKLKNVIFGKYMPADISGNAEVEILALDPSRQYDKEVADIVVVNENGGDCLLSVSGTAKNLRLTNVDYSDNGFTGTGDIWFANYISDSLVQIKLIVPHGIPNLMISYENENGDTVEYYVSQSEISNAPALVTDDIKAVG